MTETGSFMYQQAIDFLYGLQWFGARLGLENTFRLAEMAGNPQQKLRFIHVAGTNGKGSTCAMLEAIYRAAGFRVGLFTSPHLVSFRERLQVNREMIAPDDVVRLVNRMQPLLSRFYSEDHPTFFEVVAVMGLIYFAEQNCDLVIWETGLGGRLDATNIVTPVASVITTIQHDHQRWLGETLSSIASEKAGIIKEGVPVVIGVTDPEALEVIMRIAAEKHAKISKPKSLESAADGIEVGLAGDHQRHNAAVALATVQALQAKLPVKETAVRAGLAGVTWAGRFQSLRLPDGRQIILDGAHNVAGAEALAKELAKSSLGRPSAMIIGILQDKDWRAICRILAPLADSILLVPVQNERTALPPELRAACAETNPTAQISCCASLAEALTKSKGEPFAVITGSLYLIGEALELLGISSNAQLDERRLNEWSIAGTSP